jgi:hypothetical protein
MTDDVRFFSRSPSGIRVTSKDWARSGRGMHSHGDCTYKGEIISFGREIGGGVRVRSPWASGGIIWVGQEAQSRILNTGLQWRKIC